MTSGYPATMLVSDFEQVQAVLNSVIESVAQRSNLSGNLFRRSAQSHFTHIAKRFKQTGHAEKLVLQVPDRETRLNEKNPDWECVVGDLEVMLATVQQNLEP
jgi:hypothetical protein